MKKKKIKKTNQTIINDMNAKLNAASISKQSDFPQTGCYYVWVG